MIDENGNDDLYGGYTTGLVRLKGRAKKVVSCTTERGATVAFPPRLEAPVIRDRHRVRTTKKGKSRYDAYNTHLL